jgi:ABC-type sugar transport system ATPase subunit
VRYRGARARALEGASFSLEAARTLAVIGPSGAGKTSLLRGLAGLAPASGRVTVDGRRVDGLEPQRRRIAVLFAAESLLDHRSVRDNIALAMPVRDQSQIERIARVLDIEAHLERRPRELSSGERQRAAIARAVLAGPAALLLDEPLAPLDPQLRARVRAELIGVRSSFMGPMIVVTHDHADAMTLADELAVMIDGRIEDFGPPQRVYDAPASLRVATFFGVRPMNVLDGAVLGEIGDRIVGVRPERVRLAGDGLEGRVEAIERTGADAYVAVVTAAGRVCARVRPDEAPPLDTRVHLRWEAADVRRFERASGRAVA